MSQEDKAPPIHFHNEKTGVRVWPKMKKDSDGKWVVSSPEFVDNMLGLPKKVSGKTK